MIRRSILSSLGEKNGENKEKSRIRRLIEASGEESTTRTKKKHEFVVLLD